MVQNKLTPEMVLEKADELAFPGSVVEYFMVCVFSFTLKYVYLQGQLGQPPYGFPEPLRTRILRGKKPLEGRPGENMAPIDFDKIQTDLEQKYERPLRFVFYFI